MTVARWRAAVEGFQLLTKSCSVRSIDLCWTRTLCLHIWPPSFPHLVLGERERGEREGGSRVSWERLADRMMYLGEWSSCPVGPECRRAVAAWPHKERRLAPDIPASLRYRTETHCQKKIHILSAAWLSYSRGEEGYERVFILPQFASALARALSSSASPQADLCSIYQPSTTPRSKVRQLHGWQAGWGVTVNLTVSKPDYVVWYKFFYKPTFFSPLWRLLTSFLWRSFFSGEGKKNK